MGEQEFRCLLGRTARLTAGGVGILGVASLFWPIGALGLLAGLVLGSIDLLSLGLRLPLWAKASRGTAMFLVNTRFLCRLGLLAVVTYSLERWVGMGIVPWATVGIFLPQITFGVEAWFALLHRRQRTTEEVTK